MKGGWAKFAIFSQYVAVSQQRCKIGPRLLLVTNRKSYTGSRLPPISVTLDDLERKNRGFYGFLGNTSYPMSVAGSMSLDLFAVGLQTCTTVACSPSR